MGSNLEDKAILALIEALGDSDDDVRSTVNVALGDFGPAAKIAIPKLLEVALKDPTERGRQFSPEALAKIDTDLKLVIPDLVKAIQDPDARIRANAVHTLGSFSGYFYHLLERNARDSNDNWEVPPGIRTIAPQLIAALKDPDPMVRSRAANALRDFASEVKDISQMVRASATEAPHNSAATAQASQYASEIELAIPDLIPLLKDRDAGVRASAISALKSFDYSGKETTEQLIKTEFATALKDPDAKVRATAAHTLGEIGTDGKQIIPELITLLKDSDGQVRAMAASALGNFASRDKGWDVKAAVPELIALLEDSNEWARGNAAKAIGVIGAEPAIVVPRLVRLLKDQKSHIARSAAITALGNLGAMPEIVVPELIALLESQDFIDQSMALIALGQFGPDAEAAVPALIKILQTPEHLFRHWAVMALKSIGPGAKTAVPALTTALKDSDQFVFLLTASALEGIAIEAECAFSSLTEASEEPSEVRNGIAEALAEVFLTDKVDTVGKLSVATLAPALNDSNPYVRSFAANGLAAMGKAAQESIPTLISKVGDPDPRVQMSVVFALGMIGDGSPRGLEAVSTADLEQATLLLKKLLQQAESHDYCDAKELNKLRKLQTSFQIMRDTRSQK